MEEILRFYCILESLNHFGYTPFELSGRRVNSGFLVGVLLAGKSISGI